MPQSSINANTRWVNIVRTKRPRHWKQWQQQRLHLLPHQGRHVGDHEEDQKLEDCIEAGSCWELGREEEAEGEEPQSQEVHPPCSAVLKKVFLVKAGTSPPHLLVAQWWFLSYWYSDFSVIDIRISASINCGQLNSDRLYIMTVASLVHMYAIHCMVFWLCNE